MALDFKKLYSPYSEQASLEKTFTWMKKECLGRGISDDIMHQAIGEVFLEMHNGLDFPTDGADTGFDGVPHACMNIYMLERAIKLNGLAMKAVRIATEGSINALIENHVKLLKGKQGRIRRLFNFNRSPIVRGLKWIF